MILRLANVPERAAAWPLTTCLALALLSLVPRWAVLLLVVGLNSPLAGDEHDYHDIADLWSSGAGFYERQDPAKYVRPFLQLSPRRAASWEMVGPIDPASRVDGLPPHRSARPPLTPLVLGMAYALFGPDVAVARVLMTLLASLIAPAVWLLGRQWYGDRSWSPVAAAVAWVAYPYAVFDASQVMTETLAGLLMVLALWQFVRACQLRSAVSAVAAGALWGLLILDRSNFIALPLWLAGAQALMAHGSDVRLEARGWLAALVACAAVLTPWTVRNFRVHGAFMPTTSDLGRLLVACNLNLERQPIVAAGGYFHDPRYRGYLETFPEAQWTQRAVGLLRDELPREPWRKLPAIVARRAKNFWTYKYDPYEDLRTNADSKSSPRVQSLKKVRNLIMGLAWFPMLAAFWASLWKRDAPRPWWLWAAVLYAFCMALPFWGTPRFRLPVDGLIALAAAVWCDRREKQARIAGN